MAKNAKTLNWFHVLKMYKKFPRLKSFTAVFWQFVVTFIVLGKLKVSAGLQIHPKNILRRTNKAHKAQK